MTEFDVDKHAPLGFVLVIAAGLSTGLGAAVVFFKNKEKGIDPEQEWVLAAGMGLSGGVMIYVSFIEIFVKSLEAFEDVLKDEEDGESNAYLLATGCFFVGVFMMKLIGFIAHKLDPQGQHHCGNSPNQARAAEVREAPELEPVAEQADPAATAEEGVAPPQVQVDTATPAKKAEQVSPDADRKRVQQMGVKTAIAIAIHNFPEGLATFVGTIAEPSVGVTLAIAIAIHNIPEGLCVAVPINYATKQPLKAFLWALLSGISEPIGAIIGYAILKASGDDMSQTVYGVLFGIVGGMMVAIVLMELLPTAFAKDPLDKVVTNSIIAGMGVMATSLVLFAYQGSGH